MRAWGLGPFENDDALDWFASIAGSEDLGDIEAALDGVDRSALALEAPVCSVALAAAEIFAAVAGQPGAKLPEDVRVFVRRFGNASSLQIAKARVAVIRILRDSELRDLWRDSNDLAVWQAGVRDLERRLLDRS